eukprot:TRINITY_DN3630_c0_g1_i2.p1 TRINITY_DN3630_c0_g1~~TRINITY_DN3630_c0_g1_i2.p1  ORF type:complete len:389 (+),score=64.89 TRINITY_DN3630_c0_g1_i2:80-1246(+)
MGRFLFLLLLVHVCYVVCLSSKASNQRVLSRLFGQPQEEQEMETTVEETPTEQVEMTVEETPTEQQGETTVEEETPVDSDAEPEEPVVGEPAPVDPVVDPVTPAPVVSQPLPRVQANVVENNPVEISCTMTDWTDWSLCTGPCGSQIRRRAVLGKPTTVKKCPATEQVRLCQQDESCSMTCLVTPWSPWMGFGPDCNNQARKRKVIRSNNATCPPLQDWSEPKKKQEPFNANYTIFVLQDLMKQYYQLQAKVFTKHNNQLTKIATSKPASPRPSPRRSKTTMAPTIPPQVLLAELQPLRDAAVAQTEKYQQLLDQQQALLTELKPALEMNRLLKLQADVNEDIQNPQDIVPVGRPDCSAASGDTRVVAAFNAYVPPVSFAPDISEETF